MTTSHARARAQPRGRRGRVAALAGTLGIVAATLAAAAPAATPAASATTAAPVASAAVTMTLEQVPASVPVAGHLHIHIHLAGPASGMIVRVSAHDAITSRTGFSDILAGHDPGPVVDSVSIPFVYLPTVSSGIRDILVPLQDPSRSLRPGELGVVHTGVYPLTISLSPPNGDPVASVQTWLVVAQQTLAARLSFAWVWQLVGTPLTSANGKQVDAAVQPDGRLGHAATALSEADGVPLSLVLGPETFETWARIASKDPAAAQGFDAVRAAVGDESHRQVLATTYVPLDIPSLEAAGSAGDVVADVRIGTDAIDTALGVLPDPRTVLLDPVDSQSVQIAHEAFAERFVVRDDAVVPVPHVLTPARPFLVSTPDGKSPAGASNAFVADLLNGPGSRAERAQRFLAGLSLIALEAPSDPRGIVVATPQLWDPDPQLVALVLKGLRGNPFLRATTLDGYFSATPRDTNRGGSPVITTLRPIHPAPPTVTTKQLDSARQSLASFRSLVGQSDPRVTQGEHSILIAPSSALAAADATHELATIDRAAEGFLSSISTTPRTVTLTSRSARIPLSFTNATGQTVRVKVHLASAKLRFPEGSEAVLELPPKNTTRRFLVEARTSGTFTMRVTLTTADDEFTIETTEMTVRSTVFSGIGVLLTVGALLFLAVWWGNHIWRSRRSRRATEPSGLGT